ncbi:4-hydroxyphenylacetate 3-hydroxylase family protein [Brevibacillus massiliensis]|uniref:4-hydroxyphenylacetate 3-hydroxylase family protein n=1 Tax=Brevibacillus massiliensis TaxID=1118054 RepID=UPI0002FB6949|nr:4-hydroxyphenylacetate 3-hydroxylase N-terminal domain-containing protein [Brevibacillus massiliensis]
MTASQRYLSRLRDGRSVWLQGKIVEDLPSHPAFAGTIQTICALLALQDDPASQPSLTFSPPDTGKPANLAYLVPGSKEEVLQKETAYRIWSEKTFGMMSRLSDYSRSLLTGWYASRHVLGGSDGKFADKIDRYYRLSRDQDLFSTTALHDPQVDRSKLSSQFDDPHTHLRIVRETEDGIIVRGAKMIATGAPYYDEIFVYPFHRRPQSEARYATMFAVPVATKGVHIVCRESFASENAEDHPLSSRFDEMDAVVVFDDALIPWERVFIKDDPEAIWRLRQDPVAVALSQQPTVVRLLQKLEFVAAIGHELACTIGARQYLHVQEKLGELIIQAETIRALLLAARERAKPNQYGVWLPAVEPLTTARNLGSRYYPRALEIIQQIGAGGFLQVPSALAELNGPIGPFIQKYYRGAEVQAETRLKLFKLAWDLIGSPLASRHELYERFYSGDPVRTYASQYAGYDRQELIQTVWELAKSDAR